MKIGKHFRRGDSNHNAARIFRQRDGMQKTLPEGEQSFQLIFDLSQECFNEHLAGEEG